MSADGLSGLMDFRTLHSTIGPEVRYHAHELSFTVGVTRLTF